METFLFKINEVTAEVIYLEFILKQEIKDLIES